MCRSHMARDAPARGHKSQTPPPPEAGPKHVTHRSLPLTGPAHIFAAPARAAVGSSNGLPREQPYLGSSLDLLHAARVVNMCSFVLCFFQSPKCLGLFDFSRGLTFDRLVHLLAFCNTWSPIPIPRHLDKKHANLRSGVVAPISSLPPPWCR